jgi:RimJ/RimL family protein N-acetyltransferase
MVAVEKNLLQGVLVRLVAEEPEEQAEAIARWNCDTEWWRLLATEPSNQPSVKKICQWIEQDQQIDEPTACSFAIRILEDNRLIGFIGLDGDMFPHGEAFVGIGIGGRKFWSKGYGTDAIKVILRFAFQEMNLRRVRLDTFEYNLRAIHSYEKIGFVHEGRARGFLNREGKRWDLIFMGILKEEWLSTETI